MPSSTNWMNSLSYSNSIPVTLMSNRVFMTRDEVKSLVKALADGNVSTGFFQDASEWLQSLQYFPFRLNRQGESTQPLTVKGTSVTHTATVDPVYCYPYHSSDFMFYMGQYEVFPQYQDFRDYNGYTQIYVYLPYYGFVEIQPNDVMGKYMQFRLKVDVSSGEGLYYIGVTDTPKTAPSIQYGKPIITNDNFDNDTRIISTISFKLSIDIPITRTNVVEQKRNMFMGAVKAAAAIATQGATLAITPAESVTSRSTTTYNVTGRAKSKGSRMKQIKGGSVTRETTSVIDKDLAMNKTLISSTIEAGVDTLNAMHLHTTSDKSNNPILNVVGSKSIKIVRYTPKAVTTANGYNNLFGKPLGEMRRLSMLRGYTEITGIHLEGEAFDNATLEEMTMLENALTSGVLFKPL